MPAAGARTQLARVEPKDVTEVRLDAWLKLTAKQRGQLIARARSMVE